MNKYFGLTYACMYCMYISQCYVNINKQDDI